MYFWVPLYPEHPVWGFDERRHVLWLLLTIVHIIAWVIMFGVILVIDYGELIGVKQVSLFFGFVSARYAKKRLIQWYSCADITYGKHVMLDYMWGL